MLPELQSACEALDDAISRTDPAVLSGTECAMVVELLARCEKRCAALRAVAAARSAECGGHKDRGFPSPAKWLAQTSGITFGEARAALESAGHLDECPRTKEALRAGELSLAQAAAITACEAAAPGCEGDLLELAARTGVTGSKEEARRRRLEAVDADERYRAQRKSRGGKVWQDDRGMVHLSGTFTPEVGVPHSNRINNEVDRLWRQAQRDGRDDTREQLVADAIAKVILAGGDRPKARSAELVLVCDVGAMRRGHTHAGEACHIIGGGPVPVSVAWGLAKTAIIKAVLHDGVRIDTVAHFGRYIKAELRTALGLGDPPLFAGAVCSEEGCDRRYHLQIDHVDPVANGGPTSYRNLGPLCGPGHKEKTRRDREAGLLGPPAHPPADNSPRKFSGETAAAHRDTPPTGCASVTK